MTSSPPATPANPSPTPETAAATTTNATSGHTWHAPLAFYDPDSSSWKTSQATFLSEWSTYSETLPRWGMTRGGELYELPTPAHPTDAPESSSLLPTPVADHSRGLPQPGTDYASLPNVAVSLLPTPTARDHKDQGNFTPHPEKVKLPHTIAALLPTPLASDGEKGGPNQRGGAGDLRLSSAVQLLPTPNPFHMGNTETPQEWLARRADVQKRTGTRHGQALTVVAQSIHQGTPLYQGGKGPMLWNGDLTDPPSDDGNGSPDD